MYCSAKGWQWFLYYSPKKAAFLEVVVHKLCPDDIGLRKVLLDLCRTRWALRDKAYGNFFKFFKYVVTALEVIGLKEHNDDFPDNQEWSYENRSDAKVRLNTITDFEFIITFVIVYIYLNHLAGPTVRFQGKALDIIGAYAEIENIKKTYYEERRNIEIRFHYVYEVAVELARLVNVEPDMPRIVQRQKYKNNNPANTPEEYYRRNIAIPFIDHIESELKSLFSEFSLT